MSNMYNGKYSSTDQEERQWGYGENWQMAPQPDGAAPGNSTNMAQNQATLAQNTAAWRDVYGGWHDTGTASNNPSAIQQYSQSLTYQPYPMDPHLPSGVNHDERCFSSQNDPNLQFSTNTTPQTWELDPSTRPINMIAPTSQTALPFDNSASVIIDPSDPLHQWIEEFWTLVAEPLFRTHILKTAAEAHNASISMSNKMVNSKMAFGETLRQHARNILGSYWEHGQLSATEKSQNYQAALNQLPMDIPTIVADICTAGLDSGTARYHDWKTHLREGRSSNKRVYTQSVESQIEIIQELIDMGLQPKTDGRNWRKSVQSALDYVVEESNKKNVILTRGAKATAVHARIAEQRSAYRSRRSAAAPKETAGKVRKTRPNK